MLSHRLRLLRFAVRTFCVAGLAAVFGEHGTALAADLPLAQNAAGAGENSDDVDLHLKLQRNFLLQWKLSKEQRPYFLTADRIEGAAAGETIAEGNAELRGPDQSLVADWMKYTADDDTVLAHGDARLTRINGDVVSGPEMQLRLDTKVGYVDHADYSLGKFTAHGKAERIQFKGEDHYFLNLASMTTCPANQESWVLLAKDLDLDYTRDVGTAHDASVVFEGVPLFKTPWADFSLSNQRKSGFLSPTFGSTGKSGFEATIPYYWNIAPNMDATFSPRVMSKRGTEFINEFRYLEPEFRGEVHAEYLPYDAITGTERFALSVIHNQIFGNGFSGSVNFNKVSDNTYFQDLSTHIAMTSQAELLRDGSLYYGGGWWSGLIRMQSFQTLQDPNAPIVPPYRRVPQLLASGTKATPYGDFSFVAEFVDFSHPTLVSGDRFTFYPSLAVPFSTASTYITPKIGVHFTEYNLVDNANNPTTFNNDYAIVVPIASIDAGATFERDLRLFGTNYLQTLEPRLFYLNVPRVNQNNAPNFDTAIADINLVQLFSENSYVGGDRISNANQLTAAVTTRLSEADTGKERVRATLAERFYFEPQTVALNAATPLRQGNSDIVAAVTGHVTDKLVVDTLLEYEPLIGRTEQSSLILRYLPEPTKALNLGYQYDRNQNLQQVDVSAQWPIFGNYYVVGRYNYSIPDNKVLEAIAGVEYNGGCWLARFVVQRYTLSSTSSSSAVFLQLELNGLSKIGSNPLEALKRNIPGYNRINQPVTTSPGFNFYE
jgi:LPS-assembly protein